MKRKTNILLFCALLLILAGLNQNVTAQQDLTIYPMQSIPQSNFNNPALMPDCKIHIGCFPNLVTGVLPVLASYYYGFGHSGFAYSNAVHKVSNDSSYIDLARTIGSLARKNYISTNMNLELLSFGFKVKRVHYFNFSVYERFKFRLGYPKDLLSMIWYGNSRYIGKTMYFDGLGVDLSHYRELNLGYSYMHTNKWTFGGRIKVLFGMANVWTQKSLARIGIDKNYFDFYAYSGMRINVAGSEEFMSYIEDTTGEKSLDDVRVTDYLFNFNNMGAGIDLGASYKINDRFSVGASLLDLGAIRWKDGARNYISPDTTFVYEGFDLNPFGTKGDGTSNEEIVRMFFDSVKNVYQLETTEKAYWGPLNPVVYISGFYSPTKKDKVSLLSRLEIYKQAVHPSFTLGYYRTLGKTLSLAVNYSYSNRSWFNLGFGAALKVGPLQFFATSDNLFGAIMPHRVRNVNIHLGCNLVFYQKSFYPLINLYETPKTLSKKKTPSK
jgi:hypothetical protein